MEIPEVYPEVKDGSAPKGSTKKKDIYSTPFYQCDSCEHRVVQVVVEEILLTAIWKLHFSITGSCKKGPAKFSDTYSVRADGLCFGCLKLLGSR